MRSTIYEIRDLFLMSNIERRMLNEEVGCWTKYEVRSTKYGAGFWSLSYFVPGTLYLVQFISVLASCISALASESTSYLVLGTLYFVLCTMKSCYLILITWYQKKSYLFVAFVLFLSFFFLFLLWSFGRRRLCRFLGIHSFSHFRIGFVGIMGKLLPNLWKFLQESNWKLQ